MKHRLGNTPKCISCYWYREREAGEKLRDDCDGWCTCKKQLSIGVNGHKREHPPEKEQVAWMWSCKYWEDAEDRLTRFEVLTRQPGDWRTPIERELIERILHEN